MSALMEGTLEWGPCTHDIPNCDMVAQSEDLIPEPSEAVQLEDEEQETGDDADKESESDELPIDFFTFQRCHCTKKTGPGLARTSQAQVKSRDEMTMALSVGDWVLIDSDEEDEPVWLGRVMPNPEWDGKGVFRNETSRAINFLNGIRIPPRNVAAYIMWYEKIDLMTNDLDYHISRTIIDPTVQSNEYFVLQGFEMHQVTAQNNQVPRPRSVRTPRGAYARLFQNNQTNYDQWHNKEYGVVWKMDNETRREALGRCGVWR